MPNNVHDKNNKENGLLDGSFDVERARQLARYMIRQFSTTFNNKNSVGGDDGRRESSPH